MRILNERYTGNRDPRFVRIAQFVRRWAVIRGVVFYMVVQMVANSIAAFAIVVVPFAVFGRWPPRELLLFSSIGGAMSPFAWRAYRAVSDYLGGKTKNVEGELRPPKNSN